MKNLKYRTKYKIGQTQEYYNGEFYKFIYLSLTMIHHQSNLRGYNKKNKTRSIQSKRYIFAVKYIPPKVFKHLLRLQSKSGN